MDEPACETRRPLRSSTRERLGMRDLPNPSGAEYHCHWLRRGIARLGDGTVVCRFRFLSSMI